MIEDGDSIKKNLSIFWINKYLVQ